MPVHRSERPQGVAGKALETSGVYRVREMVAVENRDQVRQIPDTDLRVVLLIKGHQERVELKNPLSDVDDEVTVTPATDRDDAVVAATRPVAVAIDDLSQLLEPVCPLEDIFLFVNAAAAAYTLLVEGDE